MQPDKGKGMFGMFETNVSPAGAERITRLKHPKVSTRRPAIRPKSLCVVCHQPMIAVIQGQTTHPCCHADPYYRPATQEALDLLAEAEDFELSSNRLNDAMNQRGALADILGVPAIRFDPIIQKWESLGGPDILNRNSERRAA